MFSKDGLFGFLKTKQCTRDGKLELNSSKLNNSQKKGVQGGWSRVDDLLLKMLVDIEPNRNFRKVCMPPVDPEL